MAPALLAALDQPLADQALVSLHALSEFARPLVTVAVGGEGADELFGGYPRYRWLDAPGASRSAMPMAVKPLRRTAPSHSGLERRPAAARAQRAGADARAPPRLGHRPAAGTGATSLYGPRLAGVGAERRPRRPRRARPATSTAVRPAAG